VTDISKILSTGKVTELRLPFAVMPPSAVHDIFSPVNPVACKLRWLDLSSYWRNNACDVAAAALSNFVQSSLSLTHIDLSGNVFSDQAWTTLADAISACAPLRTVQLRRCRLSTESTEKLREAERRGLTIDVHEDDDDEDDTKPHAAGDISLSLKDPDAEGRWADAHTRTPDCNGDNAASDEDSAAHDPVDVVSTLEFEEQDEHGCALDPAWVPAGSMIGQTADSYNADADDGALDPVWIAPDSPVPRTAVMCHGVSADEDEGALDPVWVPPSASASGQQTEAGESSGRSRQLESPSANERLLERMARRRGNKTDV
jgi:hypothetical protein